MESAHRSFTFDDVLLVPAYNHRESRRLVDTTVTDRSGRLTLGLPLFTANMDTITGHAMVDFIGAKGGMGILHRFLTVERNVAEYEKCEQRCFVSIGCSEGEFERAEALSAAGAELFCVDVAHAHARYVGHTLKEMRTILPNACLMAGNVATYAGADYLASCGADLIKVGIGGGSVCTTRVKTGFGVPTLSSVRDCARVDRSIVADGGIRSPGDIVKALAFGADFVAVGNLFAGTRPTPGEVIVKPDGTRVKQYRGMASREAHDSFLGEMPDWRTAEGVCTEVAYREDEDEIVADIVGGLRSGLTYGGATSVQDLQRKLGYILVTPAAYREGLAHANG